MCWYNNLPPSWYCLWLLRRTNRTVGEGSFKARTAMSCDAPRKSNSFTWKDQNMKVEYLWCMGKGGGKALEKYTYIDN